VAERSTHYPNIKGSNPSSPAGRERGKMAKNLLVQAYYSTLLVTAVMFFIEVALADVS
jgi:hypothetical protein